MEPLFKKSFDKLPVMAILRGYDAKASVAMSFRAWDAGIDLVEIPIQSPRALEALAGVVEAGVPSGRKVGAGTITSRERLQQAILAGAAFTVAPGLDIDVARRSIDAGLPHLPGVATGTEIHNALQAGLTYLKAFPARELGSSWIKAMAGPFPEARFVATGGIDLENGIEFLQAGAAAVSLGSALSDDSQYQRLEQWTAQLS